MFIYVYLHIHIILALSCLGQQALCCDQPDLYLLSSMAHARSRGRQLERLLDMAREAAQTSPWYNGIPGLTLDIDYLRELGASEQHLEWWTYGRPLRAQDRQTRIANNHPSVARHSEWAEAEWARLESLGKVEFFEAGSPAPPNLNVNPCALLLKERPGGEEDAPPRK